MKRRYTRTDFVAFVEHVVTQLPHICLGTDVMVGFPGEDERAFTNTQTLLADLPLAYFHVFSYSERPRTYAQRYTDTVPSTLVQERSHLLRQLSGRKKAAFSRQFLGSTVRVLFEQRNGQGLHTGFSDNYIKVGVTAAEELANQLRYVHLHRLESSMAVGTLTTLPGVRSQEK
jgi:threonylcarbamoyladenosine tRNA methylthiotransferase MtaB